MAVSSDSDYLASLVATRNSLAQEIQQETAAVAATGGARAEVTISGGRTVKWDSWLSTKLKALADLNLMIEQLDQPWELHVRAY